MKTITSFLVFIMLSGLSMTLFAQSQEELLTPDDASIRAINETEISTQQVTMRYVKSMMKYITRNEYAETESIRLGLLVKREHPNSFFNICKEHFRERKITPVGKNQELVVHVEFVTDLTQLNRFDFVFLDGTFNTDEKKAVLKAQENNVVMVTYNSRTEDYMINLYKDDKTGRVLYNLNIPNLSGDYVLSDDFIKMANKVQR